MRGTESGVKDDASKTLLAGAAHSFAWRSRQMLMLGNGEDGIPEATTVHIAA